MIYLVEPTTISRVRGYFFLINFIKDISKAEPKLNRSIYILYKILKNIVLSVAEYEINAAFENG